MTLIVAAVAVLIALPLVVFRGRALVRAFAWQAAWYAFAIVVARQIPAFDPYLGTVAVVVAQLALFALLLATASGDDVRWSANRAALIALLVYALMVPAMLRTAIDGDEPFYLLVTESLLHDHDLDLRNQYEGLAHSSTGRLDLHPQLGDPVGKHGEQFSRTEPFLSVLMIPGYLAGRLPGAIATIVIFGALLVRSTIRLFEDEGIDDATARGVFALFAFGPPVIFYAARIWPEVPAAFCFVEAVRGIRARRVQRWIPAVLGLVLLKLRFILVAVPLLLLAVKRETRNENASRRVALLIVLVAALAVPLIVVWLATGSATNVHSWRELLPGSPHAYLIGFFGLLADGAAGMLFQAPLYFVGTLALARWRETPPAFRAGAIASSLYILYLIPRAEWHGGWSPPLRYLVIFTPIFALGAASLWRLINPGVIAILAIWTIGLVVHGWTYPYRLFHIANGENAVGEFLSTTYRTDFSRLFPSFIRLNHAATIAHVVIVLLFVAFVFVRRWEVPATITLSIASLLLAMFFVAGRKPARVVHFEDAHVVHHGGELFPREYTVARFLYRGGWVLRRGDSLTFLSRGGNARVEYQSSTGALMEAGGRAFQFAPTPGTYGATLITLPAGRVTFRCVDGAVNLDRLLF